MGRIGIHLPATSVAVVGQRSQAVEIHTTLCKPDRGGNGVVKGFGPLVEAPVDVAHQA
ncbi:MAG: hypothetical protein M5U19_21625 [Microthrixaceae bacterium]|nr:hypothetical protein [Microthrixaceae bacterium]